MDHNRIFAGRNWRGRPGELGVAAEMLTDAHVSSARDAIVDLVVGSLFGFDPGDSTPEALEAAKLQEYLWFQRFPYTRFLGRKLRTTFTQGFDLHEYVERIESFSKDRFPILGKRTDQLVGLAAMRDIQPRTIAEWIPSKSDPYKLRAIKQEILQSDSEDYKIATVPASHLFRSTWRQEGANFEGVATQRLAGGPWYVKRLLKKVQLLAHNKHHVGVPVLTQGELHAPGDDQKAVAGVAKWQASDSAAVLLPFGYTLDLLNTNAGTAIQDTIDACNFDILHAQGFGYLLHGSASGKTSGSHALADVQGGHAIARLDAWGDFTAEGMNLPEDGPSPIERLHMHNYGPKVATPIFVVRHMPTVRFDQILPLIWDGMNAGGITGDDDLEDFARMVMKVSKRNPDSARAKQLADRIAEERKETKEAVPA